MDGLEWSTGSSSLWVLLRIRSLISIEHHAEWGAVMEASMASIFNPADLAKRWKLYTVAAEPGTQEKGPDKEDITKFRCVLRSDPRAASPASLKDRFAEQ